MELSVLYCVHGWTLLDSQRSNFAWFSTLFYHHIYRKCLSVFYFK